jgi:diguanylate cyclase (GGDEF)-like protein
MTSRHALAGVALRPVMDMSDGRVVAYGATGRWAGSRPHPVDLVDLALKRAAHLGVAPMLVHLEPDLLDDPSFDPVAHARATGCGPAEVVWMLPDPRQRGRGDGFASLQGHAERLAREGFRIGLDGVSPLTVSWEEVVETRPAFLVMAADAVEHLKADSAAAALAGLLAFCGHLGARLVASGVDSDATARLLLEAGVFYGMGDHLHGPVVLDPSLALEGDLVVRPSWFKERSVRRLTTGTRAEPEVRFLPAMSHPHVIDDRHLAAMLTEWSGQLTSAGDATAVLQALVEIVPQLVPADRIAVFEADWDRYLLRPRILVGEALQPLRDVTYTLNIGITGWAFLQGQPYRCGSTAEHPEAAPIPEQDDADESMIVVPLISGTARLGVLDLWRDGADRYSERDLERAALLGKLGADAWCAANQRAELAERVVTDTVTGLLNKRWWEELAPREAAQALRSKSSIGVLLVDLDGFKSVNDAHGHASGDVVLKQVARTLTSAVRSGDAVVRFGGDEFVLLLRDCDEKGAHEVATEVREALARLAPLNGGGSQVTASIGIAILPDHGHTLEDVVGHADAAMYRAKALGRDQIALYSSLVAAGEVPGW